MRFLFNILWISLNLFVILTVPANAEWRLEAYLGQASSSNSDLRIQQPSRQTDLVFHDIEYDDRSLRTPLYYGLRVNYFPDRYPSFGLEAEFIHAKTYSKSEQGVHVSGTKRGELIDSTIRFGDIVQGFSMSHGLNFLFFNLVGRLGLLREEGDSRNKVELCGRVGIGPLIPHTESTIEGEEKEQYEIHGPAYQLAAATEVRIAHSLAVLMEYKYTYVEVKDAKIQNGHAETDIRTRHLVFGIGRRF